MSDHYAEHAVRNALARLAAAAEGTRNETLFLESCGLYGLHLAHRIDDPTDILRDTAHTLGLPLREIDAVLTSARHRATPNETGQRTGSSPNGTAPRPTLADYAHAHGVDESVFTAAGWATSTYQGRPCVRFLTASGNRCRFLDGDSPKYTHKRGYQPCWYGLSRAVEMATDHELPLVLCNGEASTVVAQHHGIPACCVTSGGERRIPDALVEEFRTRLVRPNRCCP